MDSFAPARRRLEQAGAQWELYRETLYRQRVRTDARGGVNLDYALAEEGAALRILRGGKPGFAFCSPPSAAALETAALDALASADTLPSRPGLRFAPATRLPDLFSAPPANHNERLHDLAAAMTTEVTGRSNVSRNLSVREALAQFERRVITLQNSNGLKGGFALDSWALSLEVIATATGRKGEMRQAAGGAFAPAPDGLDPAEFAAGLAAQATALLGAKPPPAGRYPILLDGRAAVELFAACALLHDGEEIAAGRSLLSHMAGQPEKMRHENPEAWLYDDPVFPGGYGPQWFDGEGTPARRVTLSAPGSDVGIFDSLESAGAARRLPSGSALRPHYKAPPRPAPRYIVIPAGRRSRAELFAAAEGGLYITQLYGLHTLNPVSGEFALGASGFHIKGSAAAAPVSGFTLAGSYPALLKAIRGRGDVLHLGAEGAAPLLWLGGLKVSG